MYKVGKKRVQYLQVTFIFYRMMHYQKRKWKKKGYFSEYIINVLLIYIYILVYKVINAHPLEKELYKDRYKDKCQT